MLNHVMNFSSICLINGIFYLAGNFFKLLPIRETGYLPKEALVYEEDRMRKETSVFLIEDNRSNYR